MNNTKATLSKDDLPTVLADGKVTDDDGKALSGKSYYIYETADNGGRRWSPVKKEGPLSLKSAIDFIAKNDPFIKRASQYKINGEIYPYFYITRKDYHEKLVSAKKCIWY